MSAPTPARRIAYEVLRRVFEHDAYADRSLRSALDRHPVESRERALAQRLAYGSVQRRGTSDHVIETLARRSPARIDPPLLAALRLGVFELLYDEGAADYAAVDQAVELAKGGRAGGRRHRGAALVNAVLRRCAEEGAELLAALDDETPAGAATLHSVPRWIAELWWRERGAERARSLMRAANVPPERVYRLPEDGAPSELAERVELGAPSLDAVIDLVATSLVAVRGGDRSAVDRAVEAGRLVPQSAGSALVADVLGVEPGDRVLDLCAAPGIKATQLAAVAGPSGEVVAVERDRGRAAGLEELCRRLGVAGVEVRVGDGRRLDLGSGYDRVLVDAPCSGLGTLASRPDVRWRRSPADIERLPLLQRGLLEAGCRALRPGGRLVYSVCTVSRAEGPELVAELLDRVPLDAGELPESTTGLADEDPRFLQLLPDRDRTDGFFIAALERRGGGG